MRIDGNKVWIPTSVEALISFPSPRVPDIKLNHYTTVSGHTDAALAPARASATCQPEFSECHRMGTLDADGRSPRTPDEQSLWS